MKSLISFIAAVLLSVPALGQEQTATDSLYRKVQVFGILLPQEKVYLQFDTPATSSATI